MRSTQYLPEEVKKSFGFKLAAYILPALIFALLSILLLVPAPKPAAGLIQGQVGTTSTAATLVAESIQNGETIAEIALAPGSSYSLTVPAGKYRFTLKERDKISAQLPRTLIIAPNSSAIFDISVE